MQEAIGILSSAGPSEPQSVMEPIAALPAVTARTLLLEPTGGAAGGSELVWKGLS
jgi:hypothetical protein